MRPRHPSSRRVTAAFPPASPVPTMTAVWCEVKRSRLFERSSYGETHCWRSVEAVTCGLKFEFKIRGECGIRPAVEVVQPANCGLSEVSGVAVPVAIGRNGPGTGLGALGSTFTPSPHA